MTQSDDTQENRPQGGATTEAPPRVVIRPRPVPRERNRVLAIMLVGFAVLVLVIVLAMSALFQYVDVTHVLEGL